jgi:hypothetical protein
MIRPELTETFKEDVIGYESRPPRTVGRGCRIRSLCVAAQTQHAALLVLVTRAELSLGVAEPVS